MIVKQYNHYTACSHKCLETEKYAENVKATKQSLILRAGDAIPIYFLYNLPYPVFIFFVL